MTEGDRDRPASEDARSLKSLDRRLEAAKSRSGRPGAGHSGGGSEGMGIGLRIAVELVAAVLVGTGIGIVLDKWLGTQPWLMILFFVLGCGAAFRNVYRTAQEYERKVKERKAAERAERE